jgi:hypothetical protein
MNNRRSNENLVEELEGRQMAVATMNMPAAYKNFYRVQIAAIKQEMGRRSRAAAVARNEPRRPARAAKVIQKKFKNMYYMPNNNAIGLRGRGYRKTMARLGGRANTENLNRNALRIARLNYNARRSNEGQGRLVEARNLANNLRMQYGENAANNALRRARNAVRRARDL